MRKMEYIKLDVEAVIEAREEICERNQIEGQKLLC